MSQFRLFVVMCFLINFSGPKIFASSRDDLYDRFQYREETSFGTIRPDDVAKPAQTDLSPSGSNPSEASLGVDPDNKIRSNDNEREAIEKPKYRDIYLNESKKSRTYNDEDSVNFLAGVGFGFKEFMGRLGVIFPLNRYAAWSFMFHYLNRNDEKDQEINTAGDVSIVFKLPNPTPLTPFVSAGPGYEAWKRSSMVAQNLEVFDNSGSIIGTWSAGGIVKLSRYVSMVGELKSVSYAENSPRSFEAEHLDRDPRTSKRFELGFTFNF